MSGLGYRQLLACLAGEYTLDEAIRRIKTGTHRFIRQQNTWFPLQDERIHWLQLPVDAEAVSRQVSAFMEQG